MRLCIQVAGDEIEIGVDRMRVIIPAHTCSTSAPGEAASQPPPRPDPTRCPTSPHNSPISPATSPQHRGEDPLLEAGECVFREGEGGGGKVREGGRVGVVGEGGGLGSPGGGSIRAPGTPEEKIV